jgi:hypothetical protein
MTPRVTWVLLVIAGATACSSRTTGLKPVESGSSSALQRERFLRRLHLDLTGAGPSAEQLTAGLGALAAADTPAQRASIADTLLAAPAFGATFVGELENRVLSGETLLARYNLICASLRNFDVPCQSCPQPTDGNLCHACECASVKQMGEEHALLSRAASDMSSGTATSTIERRYAASLMFQYSFGEPAAIASNMFERFLGRAPTADEARNAAQLTYGQAQQLRGLLFQRHGASYDDLVDILFTSESYRESIVDATFLRYLGRDASPDELRHFSAALDPAKADLRPVIRAVVSSREYLAQ